jgi:hypothetical protein
MQEKTPSQQYARSDIDLKAASEKIEHRFPEPGWRRNNEEGGVQTSHPKSLRGPDDRPYRKNTLIAT